MSEGEPTNPKPGGKRKLAIAGVLLVIVALISLSGFLYYKYQEVLHKPTASQQLIQYISQTVRLPDEEPTILTITDKTKLNNALLASRVDNGDQLLLFSKAQQVVIYNPSSKKVTGMLTIQDPDVVTKQTTPTIDSPPKR